MALKLTCDFFNQLYYPKGEIREFKSFVSHAVQLAPSPCFNCYHPILKMFTYFFLLKLLAI